MNEMPAAATPRRARFWIGLGAGFALLTGALALLLGVLGIVGKGGAADAQTAVPNLLTGVASVVGACGYLARRRWAAPVYGIATVGHFVSHAILLFGLAGSGRMSAPRVASLLLVPVLSGIVLAGMAAHRKSGVLR